MKVMKVVTKPTPVTSKEDITNEKKPFNIDWNFIRELEGFSLVGYIPAEEKETSSANSNRVKSGVTICAGFDLGQHNWTYLREELNLPNEIAVKLIPYMGIVGKEAKWLLSEQPLRLTRPEAELVDERVKQDKALAVAKMYGEDEFYKLPSEAQTVVMAVAFQYGNLPKRTPKFWKLCKAKEWLEVVLELEDFGDSYNTRRNKEAQLLLTAVTDMC